MDNFNQLPSNFQPSSSNQHPCDQQRLERLWLLPAAPSQARLSNPKVLKTPRLLKSLGNWLVRALTDSQQIRIWTKPTSAGSVWFAYDPATRQTVQRLSEADLRVWLEKRYQQ
jgi:hypothetical protein